MEYKEIYEEMKKAIMDEDGNGYLIDIYDPFHNSLANLESDKNLHCQDLCRKFAKKLYEDTGDKYVLEGLSLICQYVGECLNLGDVVKVAGTKYDPEFMFSDVDWEKIKVRPEPYYELHIKRSQFNDDDTTTASEEIETYDSYEAAKKAMEGNAGWYRSVAEIIPDLIAVDTDTEFEDSKKALSMKIVKVQKE